MEEEKWKNIDGFGGTYQISNYGNARSIDRVIFNNGCGAWQSVKGSKLKPSKDSGGYLYIILYDKVTKHRQTLKIHRLVAINFVDGYEDGLTVNHINGIRSYNFYLNLEWITQKENIRDKYKRGYKNPSGELNHKSKLKNSDIGVIISLYYDGVSQPIIAKAFGVSQPTISNIITNKTFTNATLDGLIEAGLAIDKRTT